MSIINRPTPAKKHRPMPTNPKPVLEVIQVPVYRVHHTKLEAYIEQVFGFEFDFLMAVGITEGQCVEYTVTGDIPTTEWLRRADELRSGRRSRSATLILAVLCHDGYIRQGHYTVITHPLPDPTVAYTHLLYKTLDPDAPECQAFRERNRGNATFVQRAAILDAKVREAVAN